MATTEPDGSRRGAPQIVAEYELRGRSTRYPSADTFLAIHRPTGGARLLYVLRPAAMQDRALVHRAACEVDAVRWVQHASVPTVDPCGETPQGRLYIAVERRDGQTLGEVVNELGKLDGESLVRVAARLVEALDQAHAVGLVHARLTPASVVLGAPDASGRRSVSLLGLGTSAATARPIEGDELAYVSPEQVAGGALDARSDVFALASVLQLALDGVPPLPELARRALRGTPTAARLDSAMPGQTGAPRTAAAVIARARSAEPAARYASVKAFWEDLLGALVREARGAAPETHAEPRTAAVRPEPRPESRPAPRPAPRVEASTGWALLPALDESDLLDTLPIAEALVVDDEFVVAEIAAPIAPAVPSVRPRAIPAMPPAVAPAAPVAPSAWAAARASEPSPSYERPAEPTITRPTRSAPWRWAAVGIAAVGLAGVAGFARAGNGARPTNATTVSEGNGALRTDPSTPIAPANESNASAPTNARQEKAALAAAEEKKDEEKAALVKVPRLADIALPDIKVATSQPVQRELVRAEELAAGAAGLGARDRVDASHAASGAAESLSPATARREAERAVGDFARALGLRDLAALRRAAPKMQAADRDRWANVFRDAQSVTARLSVVDVQVDGESIVAKVRSQIAVSMPGTSTPHRVDAVSVATLVHDSTGWQLFTVP